MVHPFVRAAGHPVRLHPFVDDEGTVWAVALTTDTTRCRTIRSTDGGATWAPRGPVSCSRPGPSSLSSTVAGSSVVTLVDGSGADLDEAESAPPSSATPPPTPSPTPPVASTIAVSSVRTGRRLATAVVPASTALVSQHLVRIAATAYLVTTRTSGPSTLAPVSAASGAVGFPSPITDDDVVQGAYGNVAWSWNDTSLRVFATGPTAPTAVVPR